MEKIETPKTIYAPEEKKERPHISLSENQKEAVRRITLGVEEIDETVRQTAQEDVIKTLENGHALNRLIEDMEGNIAGYIACEDFVPKEAYIKYFATTGGTGRDILKEIPAFLEYAAKEGYIKLNFHGWNERLNHVMERYGFKRIRTDSWADLKADFYEKDLVQAKTSEQISEERKRTFEEKYIQKINQDYESIRAGFSDENRQAKEKSITENFQTLNNRLAQQEGIVFGDLQKSIIKLKLARYFQNNETMDTNTLFDAIIESPKFINTDKGSLHRLFEVHEEKTLQKIAEMRKKRAEMSGKEGFNPYENLFTSKSGNYYLARLLNMPHLEEESEYMDHCVGTSDSYVNRIKKGEIEIFSFRNAPKINPQTQKLEGDTPIITIEYDLKTGTINQIKKKDDEYLRENDPYFEDVIDVIKQLRATKNDLGESRQINKINPSELQNLEVEPYHILTDQGKVHFRDIDPKDNPLILKTGKIELTLNITREDAAKLIQIFDRLEFNPDQIARTPDEITESTKAYVGQLEPGIFQRLPENLEHVYTSFPDKKIRRENVEIGGKSAEQLISEMEAAGINISDYAKSMLKNREFVPGKNPEEATLIRLTVADLGFKSNATIDQIYERAQILGLELCPADTGPNYRLNTVTDL